MSDTDQEENKTNLEAAVRASEGYAALKIMYSGVDYISDLEALGNLTEGAKNRQADKAAVLQMLEQYKQQKETENQDAAIKRLISDYKAKVIEPREGIHTRIKSLSRASLMRWRKQVRLGGWASLAGDFKSRAQSFFDKQPQALETLRVLCKDFPKARNVDLYRVLIMELKKAGIRPPSESAVNRVLRKIKVQG